VEDLKVILLPSIRPLNVISDSKCSTKKKKGCATKIFGFSCSKDIEIVVQNLCVLELVNSF
jgi:hypothetical protein